MVQIDLSPKEQEILRAMLENYLSDLRMEIAATENKDFRDALKEKRDLVAKVVAALHQPVVQS